MDFSGIFLALISCIFVIFVPPILAGILFLPIFLIRKYGRHRRQVTGYDAYVLFLILYAICFLFSCVISYFVFFSKIYVM